MEFANQKWFDRFDAIMAARGVQPSLIIPDASGKPAAATTNGGLINPTEHDLYAGRTMYRFGNVLTNGRGTLATPVEGQWWIEEAEFKQIRRFAKAKMIGVPLAVRLLCSVPPEWSDMLVLVRVKLMQALKAYRGPGATVTRVNKVTGSQENFAPLVDLRGTVIRQVYVPGLANPDLRRSAIFQTGATFFSPGEAGLPGR